MRSISTRITGDSKNQLKNVSQRLYT